MNQSQRDYARDRIANIIVEARKEAKDRLSTPPVTKSLEEKLQMIEGGEVELDHERSYSTRSGLNLFIKGGKWPCDSTGELDEDAFDAFIGPLQKEARELRDEVMLGDGPDILEKVKAFEEKVQAQLENLEEK
jgi:hypothetical protein